MTAVAATGFRFSHFHQAVFSRASMDSPHHHAWSRNDCCEKSQRLLEMTKRGVGTYTNRVT
jgi:hypothetical protein